MKKGARISQKLEILQFQILLKVENPRSETESHDADVDKDIKFTHFKIIFYLWFRFDAKKAKLTLILRLQAQRIIFPFSHTV